MMEDYAKIYRSRFQWGAVEYNIWKMGIIPPKDFPVTKSQLESLRAENKAMNLIICAFNAEFSETKKMLADNQPLVCLGSQLSKLKLINK